MVSRSTSGYSVGVVETVLLVICLLLALVALGVGIAMTASLKALNRQLAQLSKQLAKVQSDLAESESKLKVLTARQQVQKNRADQVTDILTSVLGGGKWATLSKLAILGYKEVRGRRKAANPPALPPHKTTDGE